MGAIPFPIKIIHSTMSTLQETVYRNDSVLLNLHESCFTNTNFDLKVYFITNFSLTKSRSQNVSLLWNIDTFVKNLYMQVSFITTLNYCMFWAFIKLYIKMMVNQHFNFISEPVTSHCSAYCYQLFQTIWISAIKRCNIN